MWCLRMATITTVTATTTIAANAIHPSRAMETAWSADTWRDYLMRFLSQVVRLLELSDGGASVVVCDDLMSPVS